MVFDSDSSLDSHIEFILNMHQGKDNAIGRWELVERAFGEHAVEPRNDTNIWDRKVRESIERLRNAGRHICNIGNGRGYYVAGSREEYEDWKRYFLGAAYKKLETIRPMDEHADERWGRLPKDHSPLQERMF